MTGPKRGLRHVTALAAAPQPVVDFHMGVLGRRLVKHTVSFEEPAAAHLYCCDSTGSPAAPPALFAFSDAGRGRAGSAMATAVAWGAPPGGLMAWMIALAERAG